MLLHLLISEKNKLAISSNFNSRNTFRDQQYTLKNGDANFNNTSVGYVRNNDLDLGGYVNVDYDLYRKTKHRFKL